MTIFDWSPRLFNRSLFLKLLVAGHMTIYLTRNKGPIWERPWPSWKLIVPCETTQIVGTLDGGLRVVYDANRLEIGALWSGAMLLAFSSCGERSQDRGLSVARLPRRAAIPSPCADRRPCGGLIATKSANNHQSKGATVQSNSPVKSSEFSFTSVPAFWPMAMAAQLAEDRRRALRARISTSSTKRSKFTTNCVPKLATPNTARLRTANDDAARLR